jgi:hypothetical protein
VTHVNEERSWVDHGLHRSKVTFANSRRAAATRGGISFAAARGQDSESAAGEPLHDKAPLGPSRAASRHGVNGPDGFSGVIVDSGSNTSDPCSGRSGGRLNLLLSYAGWQPDPWVDRLPRLLEPMGITSLNATNGREASALIATHRIHVAVVDLGLPLDASSTSEHNVEFSEGGTRLLELLSRLPHSPPVVAVKRSRTHRDDARELSAALRLGAFAVVDRPHDASSMNTVLDVLRRCLERYHRGCWPGPSRGEVN